MGIEELYGSSYYNIDQKAATKVLSSLHSKLMEAIAARPGLTDIQRKALDPAVRAFADNGILGRGTNEICLYIEACYRPESPLFLSRMITNSSLTLPYLILQRVF